MAGQHEHWERERERRALIPGKPGFARGGLMMQLDQPVILVTVLTSEPLAWPLNFDDDRLVQVVLPQRFSGLTANGVSMLSGVTSTSEALIRVAPGGSGQGWRAYVAIRRGGGVEVGIGSTARYELRSAEGGTRAVAYRLFVLVHATRVAIEAQARLLDQVDQTVAASFEPFEIEVAIPDAKGSLLGGVAEGWEQPQHAFEPFSCIEDHVLVRAQVDSWPRTPGDQEQLIRLVADRICNAFGALQPLYVARQGRTAGLLSPDYA